MAQVRSKHTKPELAVRKLAHAAGLRFRLHNKNLPGSPDLVFAKHRVVIFVHGCFWHRHPGCKLASVPKTKTDFWLGKFARNVERDAVARERIESLGWRVVTIWECETRNLNIVHSKIAQIKQPLADPDNTGQSL